MLSEENGRKKTRQVTCGGALIGGDAPVSIQSMTSSDTRDAAATAAQIEALMRAGCDIVRCAVPDEAAAAALPEIRDRLRARGIEAPLVADIHFDHKLAIRAVENGADKIRINPGNIGDDDNLRAVTDCARRAGVPIRVGVNGGSLESDLIERFGGPTPEALVESAVRSIARMEKLDFDDLVVSVKSSDVRASIRAMRMLSERTDHPLHLGVTEAGAGARAVVKSAVGIGALLADGIGDTIRVSLTGDPVPEVAAARDILSSVDLLPGAIHVIACPTCGRCDVHLARIAAEVATALKPVEDARVRAARKGGITAAKPFTVAVMGCVVNGPGEASHADVGVACGANNAMLFENGAQSGVIAETDIVSALVDSVRALACIRQ
jgi:(E)-4-hydroxy-3-methylbut-2-enyl-diphosphate synthase